MTDSPEPDYSPAEDAAVLAREQQAHLAKLREIPAERARLAERERDLVHYARLLGIGWDDIAEAIGHEDNITVQEKYGEPEPGQDPF